jgi:hypothetical protein
MSQSLEDRLDITLDMRRERRLQHEAKGARTRTAIDDAHAELEHEQTKFCTEVHSIIQESVERANRHLAKRSEHYEFREVSGYYTGPLHGVGTACNPIAYELRGDGRKMGETLLVELTHDGMIEAFLVPHRPVPDVPTARIDLGWHPVPLRMFSATTASDLVVWYLAAITTRFSIGREL